MKCFLIVLGLLVPVSCGGSKDPKDLNDSASKALAAGDYKAAAADFERALSAIDNDSTSPHYTTAKLGHAEALVHSNPTQAKDEFLALAKEKPESIQDDEFSRFGQRLGEVGRFAEAAEVLRVGIEAFPESPHLLVLRDDLGKRAEASGDDDALESLQGLGYVGE